MSSPLPTPTLVFVHGAWCGSWVWKRVRRFLPEFDTIAVDLPSAGPDPTELSDLADDAAALRDAVNAIEGPVIVVAHSYGGAVASEALADCPNVQQVIYLSALVLDEGESPYKALGRQVPEGFEFDGETEYLHVSLTDPWVLFTETDPVAAAEAVEQLVPQSWSSNLAEVENLPAWKAVPSTYVICTKDAALHPAVQALFSARCDEVRRLRSDHMPMTSQPDTLADLLRAVASDPTGGYGYPRG